jgi:mannose-1-phosphate guanylyltransferase
MFIWQASKAMAEFERQQSQIFQLLQELQPSIDTDNYQTTLNSLWEKMPKISIDYGVMEGAEDMVLIPIDIAWSDVGTWPSLYEVLDVDRFGNCGKNGSEKRIVLDTHGSLFFSDKLTVAIGIDNIIVVETDDVLMICHKDRAQDVKEIVNYLKDNKMEDYL